MQNSSFTTIFYLSFLLFLASNEKKRKKSQSLLQLLSMLLRSSPCYDVITFGGIHKAQNTAHQAQALVSYKKAHIYKDANTSTSF